MKIWHLSLTVFLAIALVGCGGADQGTESDQAEAVSFETSYVVEIQDGSKVFTPETRTVTGNTGTISVENTLDAPHGFKISELGIEEVVEANKSLTIDLDRVEPGEYTVDCQLHAAHKHGKLVVKAP